MQVLVAPDSFGGTLTAREVSAAFAEGWCTVRPGDVVRQLPLSDGGEGLIDVLAGLHPRARTTHIEVAGTDTRPVRAPLLWLDALTVVIESATICGLPPVGAPRRPLEASSYGVGQALAHVVAEGAQHVVLGLGGTGVVDAGSGALNGLGMRLRTEDGSGLRVGSGDLARCTAVESGWSVWPQQGVTLQFLADTDIVLGDAVVRYGPQKGVAPAQVGPLTDALASWAQVLTEAFPGSVDAATPHTGAAGGLGFALAVALGGEFVPGAGWVAEQAGLDAAVGAADLVVTGEGRLDATTTGKIVGRVLASSKCQGRASAAVVGTVVSGTPEALGLAADRIVTAPADGPGPAAVAAVREAGRTLAQRITSVHSAGAA